jgi:hypothetical protein
MKNITNIIYQTTREINNVEDKLRIATIFLFCDKVSSSKFAELLYCNDKEKFVNDLQKEYDHYDVDFYINFSNINVKRAFEKTIEEVIKKEDASGYLKALFEKDPFALVIQEIINYDFSPHEIINFKQRIKEIQLTLF